MHRDNLPCKVYSLRKTSSAYSPKSQTMYMHEHFTQGKSQ